MVARVAVGGIWHETNTFAAGRTGLDGFRAYQFAEGKEILSRYTGTGTELGGMIEAAGRLGFSLHPTVYAAAVPSGIIAAEALGAILDRLRAGLREAGALDGVLLVLHGAAVAEGAEDADAAVLRAVREVVGPDVPVTATYDYHANLSDELVALADLLVGYDTYPHTDMAARGAEAATALARMVGEGWRPRAALRRLPLVTAPQVQGTSDEPMCSVMAAVHEAEREPGVLLVSLSMGFAYADVARLGAAVLAYAEDEAQAAKVADRLAARLWAARERLRPALLPVEAAVAEAVAAPDGPTILVDPADNVGGGAAGDGTAVLAELLRQGARGAVVVVADPEAVRVAEDSGPGGAFEAAVGGRTDEAHGPPVLVRGRVRLLADGRYRHTGSYMTGTETSMGRTAVVDADGVAVVLTSLRTMPFDDGQLRCLGIDPAAQRIIVVKSAIAWRAAFGAVARRAIVADAPGVGSSNLERFAYARRPRPIWPLDTEATYPNRRDERP